jgi:tubulin monoglycylase TTLL3/8
MKNLIWQYNLEIDDVFP